MILGHGDLASVLKEIDRSDLLFFASGVSNSKETRESEYDREINILSKQVNSNPHIVYFSSLAVFDSDTVYIRHKRKMEHLIKKFFSNYAIIRIGNITWGSNPHTLINYLKAHKDAPIQDVYRYIVDKDEFLYWVKKIPEWPCEINIPGKRMKVIDIKKKYCE